MKLLIFHFLWAFPLLLTNAVLSYITWDFQFACVDFLEPPNFSTPLRSGAYISRELKLFFCASIAPEQL